jgi:hypothetical protein
LWRFILTATFIVVGIGMIAFARHGPSPELKITGKVTGTPTPTSQLPDAAGTSAANAAFTGSGSWTLSSLPSCFRERERIRGNLVALRAKFPPPSERLRPRTVVHSGDCTIIVRDHELWVSRGADRLRVPPEAGLYRNAHGLTLVYVRGAQAEIRRY